MDRIFSESYDDLPVLLYLKSKTGLYLDANQAFLELVGLKREELVGSCDEALGISPSREQLKTLEEQVVSTHKMHIVRELIKNSLGDLLPLYSKKTYFEKQGVIGVLSSSFVEEDLHLTSDCKVQTCLHQQQIIDQFSEVYICWKDEESIFRGCNQNFADLVGKTRDEIMGLKDPFCEQHVKDDTEVRETGKSKLHLKEYIPDGDGSKVHILTNKSPWKDPSGKIVGTVVSFIKDPEYY